MNTKLVIMDGSAVREPTRAEILAAAREAAKLDKRVPFTGPASVSEYLIARLAGLEHEVFGSILLSARHHVIVSKELFRGTIDGASVFPREVIKEILAVNAAAVIFFHNHPSGAAEPSHADEVITERLKQACGLIDVRVLDHIIVAGDECVSFAAKGLL